MKLTPFSDRVVVKKVNPEPISVGGILLAEQSSTDQADVVAVGPGRALEDGSVRPVPVRVGDRVVLGKYPKATINVGGEELLVIREDDIFARLE